MSINTHLTNMQTTLSFSSLTRPCSACFLHSLPFPSSACHTKRRCLANSCRPVPFSPKHHPITLLFLSASASSDDNPQADIAPTQLSRATSADSTPPSTNNALNPSSTPPKSAPSAPSSSSSSPSSSSSSSTPIPSTSSTSNSSMFPSCSIPPSPSFLSSRNSATNSHSVSTTSQIPEITSLTLNFNGSDPLPSIASLMRYMNDLRPKLDYLEPRARERVLSALEVANVAHSGQLRKSGEPFIIHPVAVAAILADLRMDRDCIIAGLLHDTVEDTPVTLEDLETLFGADVRRIVEGETKLTKLAKKMRSTPPSQQELQAHPNPSAITPTNPCPSELSEQHMESENLNGIMDANTSNTLNGSTGLSKTPDSNSAQKQKECDKREEELQKQADNLRAMFIAMTEDVRVVIVKLADRLHNMRTLAHMSPLKQKKISKETLEFFAPLAHRLGMRRIKSELEELSFMYLHPEDYQHLKYEVEAMLARSKFDDHLKCAESTIKDVLQQDRILYNMVRSVQVIGSTKELYSIYRRIQTGENMSAMLDIATMRVVVDLDPGVDSNQACYHVLGRIHTMWKPLPNRLKDYIAFPKPNGYQSLHTTVLLGPKFDFLTMEIQIRTAEMHRIAEEGIAAQLFMAGGVVKQAGTNIFEDRGDELDNEWRRRTASWLISIREYIKEFSSSKDLVDAVRKDLLGNRVFVFTPKGSIVDLPKDSTAVDVAYRIHSDVGNSMIGAKVNGRMVSLDYKLHNADVVEIISSQYSKGPSPKWVSYAKSRTARQKIRQFLRARDRDNMLDRGRRLLEEEARANLEPIPTEASLSEIFPRLCAVVLAGKNDNKISSVDDLYVEIARRAGCKEEVPLERTVLSLLRDRRYKTISKAVSRRRTRRHNQSENEGKGTGRNGEARQSGLFFEKIEAMLAPCCHPIRGDEVCGVWMRGGENEVVMVHRKGCRLVREGSESETVSVKWAIRHREIEDGVQQGRASGVKGSNRDGESEDGEGRQPARIVVVARDCTGLLAYITGVIASMGTSIQRCSTVSDRDEMTATLAFETTVRDAFHLRRILERVEECREVELVRRVGPNESHLFFGADAYVECGKKGCERVDGAGRCDQCEEELCDELLRHGQSVEVRDLEM